MGAAGGDGWERLGSGKLLCIFDHVMSHNLIARALAGHCSNLLGCDMWSKLAQELPCAKRPVKSSVVASNRDGKLSKKPGDPGFRGLLLRLPRSLACRTQLLLPELITQRPFPQILNALESCNSEVRLHRIWTVPCSKPPARTQPSFAAKPPFWQIRQVCLPEGLLQDAGTKYFAWTQRRHSIYH